MADSSASAGDSAAEEPPPLIAAYVCVCGWVEKGEGGFQICSPQDIISTQMTIYRPGKNLDPHCPLSDLQALREGHYPASPLPHSISHLQVL